MKHVAVDPPNSHTCTYEISATCRNLGAYFLWYAYITMSHAYLPRCLRRAAGYASKGQLAKSWEDAKDSYQVHGILRLHGWLRVHDDVLLEVFLIQKDCMRAPKGPIQ